MMLRQLETRPTYIPKAPRPAGRKGLGLTYERRIGKVLRAWWPELQSGTWFEWPGGCCQVDHFVVLSSVVLLFECKLKETDAAWPQIEKYRKVLESYFGRPVVGIQVCKYLTFGKRLTLHPKLVVGCPGQNFVWHHLA
jgi:hypothetical protein